MGPRWRASKALGAVVGVLAVMIWVAVATAAAFAFERVVTLPFCHAACGEAGDELKTYRGYSRGGPPEACVCRSGLEIRPVLRNPIGFAIAGFVALPMVSLFLWGNKLAAVRSTAVRK
jgi:hypothetical protein